MADVIGSKLALGKFPNLLQIERWISFRTHMRGNHFVVSIVSDQKWCICLINRLVSEVANISSTSFGTPGATAVI